MKLKYAGYKAVISLEFAGADSSGYDIGDNFTFFFDSEEDLLSFLKR